MAVVAIVAAIGGGGDRLGVDISICIGVGVGVHVGARIAAVGSDRGTCGGGAADSIVATMGTVGVIGPWFTKATSTYRSLGGWAVLRRVGYGYRKRLRTIALHLALRAIRAW